MNRWTIPGTLALLLLWATPLSALAQQKHGQDDKHGKPEEKGPPLPLCPVMGDPVDFSAMTMTDDGPVYFCCASCPKKFEKNPQKYASKVAAQRAALEKLPRIQVTCPMSGKPIDQSVFVERDGQKIYLCCERCKGRFARDADKYMARFATSFTYQTRCPVRGEKIDPAMFADLSTGQRIYFCRKGCDKKFLQAPAKYAPKLAAQGIGIDVKKLEAGGNEHAKPGHDRGKRAHGDHG